MAYKIKRTMKYTEIAIIDDDGNEVATERMWDDSLWDESPRMELSEQERDDYL